MEAYARYGPALIRKACRMLGSVEDAEDVVHALFVELCQRGEDPRDLLDLPYLYRATTNRCLTLLRDTSTHARLLAANLDPLPHRTRCDDADAAVIGHDLLRKLVRELDDGECQVLTYRYVDDMTLEEIAELLGLSRRTIGKRLERIRVAVLRLGGDPEATP